MLVLGKAYVSMEHYVSVECRGSLNQERLAKNSQHYKPVRIQLHITHVTLQAGRRRSSSRRKNMFGWLGIKNLRLRLAIVNGETIKDGIFGQDRHSPPR